MQVRFKIKPTKRAAMRLGALALTLPMALGSCAGTGVTAEETAAFGAVRASMVDYKSGQALSLVNETYAERNAGQAVDAGTKVSTDEVVAELAKFFAEEGFWDHARPGEPAAVGSRMTDGGEPVALAFVLASDEGSGYLPLRKGITVEETDLIQILGSNFVALWNTVEDYRSVYNPSGKAVFRQPDYNR